MNIKIYILTDPISKHIRYVGITKKSLKIRLNQHISMATNNKAKAKWIKNLLRLNLTPNIVLIDVVSRFEQVKKEQYYIDLFRLAGCDLLNIAKAIASHRGLPPEKVAKNQYIYRLKNRKRIKERSRKHYLKNRKKILEKTKEAHKIWRSKPKNKKRAAETNRLYHIKHKDKIREQHRIAQRKRRELAKTLN